MKFKLIDEAKSHHNVSRISRVLGVTAAGYHAWKKRLPSKRALEDKRLKLLIGEAHSRSLGIYGAPRIHAELAMAHGVHVSRKRVARLMRELQLVGISRRRRPGRAKKKVAETPVAPDLVKRNFVADAPNRLWIADITYISTWEGWLFLSAVIDAHTKVCVGWSMRDDLQSQIVIDALGMAATRKKPPAGCIHHSDQGSQYRSLAFGRTLRESGVIPSMGSRGDAYDNAAAESFMATIKTELIHRNSFKTREEARLAVFSYIEGFYNPVRRHSTLGFHAPLEFEKMALVGTSGEPGV